MPHKQYFAGTLLGMSTCASYASRTLMSLMTSQDYKVDQILKMIYLRQYLSYGVDQKLKMSEILMAIFLVYCTSVITSGKKVCRELKKSGHFEDFEILNTSSTWPQIWKDRPKLCQKKYFHDDDVIDDVTGWPQSRPSIFLYKWNNNIFHDNWKTSKDIIIKLQFNFSIQFKSLLLLPIYISNWQ